MIRKTLCLLGAGLATVAMALPASAATLVQSFENNDINNPAQVIPNTADIASSGFDTIGASDGTGSYRVQANKTGATFLLKINLLSNPDVLAALQVDPTIMFDLTIPVDGDPNDTQNGVGTVVIANADPANGGGGFQALTYYGDYVPYGGATTTYSYTFPESVIDQLDSPGVTYSEITFGINSDPSTVAQADLYFDNIRTAATPVPEPTSLLLLSMTAVAGITVRRRRS